MAQLPEQMPGILAKIDDPWGISWRVVNGLKRFSMRRTCRFLAGYLRGVDYARPVFIIGVPRSGTTLLFHLLRASDELGALPREGHDLWRTYQHPRYTGWRSDALGKGAVRFGERRFVNAYLYAHGINTRRFVEKTPENSLRVPYLRELFPDAFFVVVKRNPGDVIHSLIQGWRHPSGRFRSYYVPRDLDIPGYSQRRRWCFALIDGWQNYVAAPIPEIAFAQWQQCTQALIAARGLVPAAQWLEVHFEHLLASREETLARLCEGINIRNTPALRKKLVDLLAEPVNALSAPGINKWREHSHEITDFFPQIATLALDAGYLVDTATGEFAIRPS
jgi:hypothetical protein